MVWIGRGRRGEEGGMSERGLGVGERWGRRGWRRKRLSRVVPVGVEEGSSGRQRGRPVGVDAWLMTEKHTELRLGRGRGRGEKRAGGGLLLRLTEPRETRPIYSQSPVFCTLSPFDS